MRDWMPCALGAGFLGFQVTQMCWGVVVWLRAVRHG
jgi:hypothetical protein